MKHIIKRILSFFFAVCMLLSSVGDLTSIAFAAENTPVLELTAKADDETYEVTASIAVDVPETWEDTTEAYLESLRQSLKLNVREIPAPAAAEEGTAAPLTENPNQTTGTETLPGGETPAANQNDMPTQEAGAPSGDTEASGSGAASEPPAERSYDDYLRQAKETLKLHDSAAVAARVFDISLYDIEADTDYQPVHPVTVSIRYSQNEPLLRDYKCLDMVHISGADDSDANVIACTVNESKDTVEFTTGSFSAFVLTGYTNRLTITAGSAEKTYDGVELTKDSYICYGLREGHRVDSLTVTGGQTNAGTASNVPGDAKIVDENGNDVTAQYEITYVNGTLTVSPAPVTLTANGGVMTAGSVEGEVELGFTYSVNGKPAEGLNFAGVNASAKDIAANSSGAYEVTFTGVTVNETRDSTGNYLVTAAVPGLLLVVTNDTELISKQIVDVQGVEATYRIEVNHDGYILNEGKGMTLKDTFSDNQSIDYSSIEVVYGGVTDIPVTYDYSGCTGTFSIPDSVPLTITYKTHLHGAAGEQTTISNTAQLGVMQDGTFIRAATATASGSYTVDPDVSAGDKGYFINLYVYPDGHLETGLKGAQFRLLDSNNRPMTYAAGEKAGQPIVFTTGDDGLARIALDEAEDGLTLHKNTAYYLEMITAPYVIEGSNYTYYQKDNTYYSFLITDDPNYSYGGIYSYFNGDMMKVRCYPDEKGGVIVTKRFSGNYALTREQMAGITFILQKEDLATSSSFVDVESHKYSEFSYGSMHFSTELKPSTTYRVIETDALPEALDGVVDHTFTVSLTYQKDGEPVEEEGAEFLVDPDDQKKFSYNLAFTNEYVDHKLTVGVLDEETGAMLPGAAFEVCRAVDFVNVKSVTTGEDGTFTIRWAGDSYAENTLYRLKETDAPDGYVLPESPEEIYFYFSDSAAVPAGLPAGKTATNLKKSYNTVILPNSPETIKIPVTVTWGIYGVTQWPQNVQSVTLGLYQSVGGAEPTRVEKEGVPLRVTLTPAKYFDTTSFVGLPALAPDENSHIRYSIREESIIDTDDAVITQEFAQSYSVSGSGWYVVNNQDAIRVTVKAEWYQSNGTPEANPDVSEVSFDLYRTTAEPAAALTRDELWEILDGAESVRAGLKLTSAGGWSLTVSSLERTDRNGNPYCYFALEYPVPDNHEDSYGIVPATSSDPRMLTIRNTKTPSTVTVTVGSLEKTYGDDDPQFAPTASVAEVDSNVVLTGPDPNGVYTATVTRSDSTTAALTFSLDRVEGENVGDYAITGTPLEVQGYRLKFELGKLTIKPVEVTVRAGAYKVYGDADPAALATIEPADAQIVFSADREEGEDVGFYYITVSGEEDQGNYHVTFDPGEFEIRPAPVTVTANNGTKVYGEFDPGLSAVVSGLRIGDPEYLISYDLTREDGENVGDYAILPAGDEIQGNYSVTYVPGTFSITPAKVTVKVTDAEKVYGDGDPEWYVAVEGLRNGDPDSVIRYKVSREDGENVRETPYTVTPHGDVNQDNYTVEYLPGSLKITRKILTVKPDDIVKALGAQTDPLLTATDLDLAELDRDVVPVYSISGDVVTWTYQREGETVPILSFSLTRAQGEDEGEYVITASGAEVQPNYYVNYETGTFRILSMLEIKVGQTIWDPLVPNAVLSYSYEAEVDLTGTGLSGEYSENDFVNGRMSFTLPAPDGSTTKTLLVPVGASLTVTKTNTHPNYTTAVMLDNEPCDSDERCVIDSADSLYTIVFAHSRITLAVQARAGENTEENARAITGSNNYFPADDYAVNADCEAAYRARIGYLMPTDKYYAYHHASLYAGNGTTRIAESVTHVRYDEQHAVWQYQTGESAFADMQEGAQLVLFYYPKHVCKIDNERFYSINEALDYVKKNIQSKTASIEMLLADYPIPATDMVTIPAGYDITIRTAGSPDYEGTAGDPAVISRSVYNNGTLFKVNGKLTLADVVLDGRKINTSAPMVECTSDSAVFTLSAGDDQQNLAAAAMIKAAGYSALKVTKGYAFLAGKMTGNNAVNGGAVYMTGGTVTVKGTIGSNAEGEQNTAERGGAVYMTGGTLEMKGSLTGNTATDGGAVYMTGGTVNNTGSVSGNTATNGGAVYITGGTLNNFTQDGHTGTISGNTATNGGAIYQSGGETVNAGSVNNNIANGSGGAMYLAGGVLNHNDGGAMTGNAADIDGGAVYGASGSVKVTGGTLSGNSASGNGGAIYSAGAPVSVTGGAIGGSAEDDANRAQNGGAIYSASAAVTIGGGNISGNAASVNGGAVYTATAAVTVTGGTLSGNAAAGNGGAIYSDSGTITYSGGAMTANSAVNGAAIFVGSGNANVSASITGNTATNGGAIGVGGTGARLYFTGNAEVNNNTMNGAQSNVAQSNVYLDVDSELVINAKSLNSSKKIGVYVPGDVTSEQVVKHGDVTGYFGAYVTEGTLANLASVFKNDRFSDLKVGYEYNRLYWISELKYDVYYLKNYDPLFPPTADYTQAPSKKVCTGKSYAPRTRGSEIYDLVTAMKLYEAHANDFKNNVGADYLTTAIYAYTFSDKALNNDFANYLKSIEWDADARRWKFIKQDGTEAPANTSKLIIFFSAPAYLTIVNNNTSNLTLNLTGDGNSLSVLGKDAATEPQYGYVTAKNGATIATLRPTTTEDLTLESGESIKLMFPGAQGQAFALNGTFTGEGAGESTTVNYTFNGGTEQTITGTTVSLSGDPYRFYASDKAAELIFGKALPICKIGNEPFSTLKAAMTYAATQKADTGNNTYKIEMLVDYLVPADDVLEIPAGYDITFTTASRNVQPLPFTGSDTSAQPKAILSRDTGNSGASVIATNSLLTVEHLAFDGRSLTAGGAGGAISTSNCATVTVDDCSFKGYRADQGGAVYVDNKNLGSKLDVKNCRFTDCQTNASVDKAGGGGIWTTARELYISNCDFDYCACLKGIAQAGSIFHNIQGGWSADSKTVISDCTFKNSFAEGGSGGTIESDALDVTVQRCSFEGSYTNKSGGSGGAINTYANNEASTSKNCTMRVINCSFDNCSAKNGAAMGGAVRCSTHYLVVRGCIFRNAQGVTGGAVAMTNTNAKQVEIYGCTFENCTATGNGGAVSAPVGTLIVGLEDASLVDYKPNYLDGTAKDGANHFTDCTANRGGGIDNAKNDASATLQEVHFTRCAARTDGGGALYTQAKTLSITGTANTFTDCTGQGNGGAVFQSRDSDGSVVTLKNCAFSGCQANGSGSGGGMYANARTLYIYSDAANQNEGNTSFTNCTANGNGGGLCYNYAGAAAIYNCAFTGCEAKTGNGGGLYTTAHTLSITGENSNFSGCKALLDGGGVFQSSNANGSAFTFWDGSFDNCTAEGNSGGAIITKAKTVTLASCGVSNSSAKATGGGVWINPGTANFTDCKISGNFLTNSDGKGGGVYVAGGTTEYKSGTVSGCTAANGGGWYQTNGSLYILGGSISGSATTNGGGLYLWDGNTKVYHYGGAVNGSAAASGGAVYINNGAYTVGNGQYNNVDYTGACVGAVNEGVYSATAGGNGGGVYQNAGTVTLNNGGSVSGSAANGGGLYLAGGSFNMNGGSVAGATASQNGGGVYVAGGTYTFKKGSIVRNTAAADGGGVYVGGGTFSMTTDNNAASCGVIGGSSENANTANRGGGIFVADGQKASFNDWASKTLEISFNHARTEGGGIAVGGLNAQLTFQNAVKVRDNTMGDDRVLCNVYLDLDSNTIIKNNWLDPTSYIGVYVKDDQQADHGLPGMPFATYSKDANLDVYHNDRSQYLSGTKGSDNLVVWSMFVCKITDGEGNLLYKNDRGNPAVYGVLENIGATGAFNALNVSGTPNLYNRDGTQYTGGEYQVQMLVGTYVLGNGRQMKMDQSVNRKVTLTTASTTPDECGFRYNGDTRFNATIIRETNTNAMVFVGGNQKWELTLRNITLDGGNFTAQEAGGILRMLNNGTAILDEGAVLQNAKTNNSTGAGVYLGAGGNALTMKAGSRIVNCSAGTGNGGGVGMDNGTFTMNGGEITGCSAKNGGGVWMNNASKIYMNGGSITGNIATSNGGGIALSSNNNGSRIYFSGLCNVTGNTLNGEIRCNVQLNRDSNAIINAQNLDVKSEIGVYTAEGNQRKNHGVEKKPFGTWTVDWNEDAKPYCFVNDCNTNLRGSQMNDSATIYWMYNYLLTVRLSVDSALTADHSQEYTFKVTVAEDRIRNHTYSDQSFNYDSPPSTKVTVSDGGFVTIHFPVSDNLNMNGTAYTVEVKQQTGFDTKVNGQPHSEELFTVTGTLGENVSSGSGESVVAVQFVRRKADLTISKEVLSENESDKSTSFPFTLTLDDPVNVTAFTVRSTTGEEAVDFETVNSKNVLRFNLKDAESVTIKDLPVSLQYTVAEGIGYENYERVRTSTDMDGNVKSGSSRTEKIVDNASATGSTNSIKFINNFFKIVCKITNRNGYLLYYNESGGNLVPAVFDRLEDAFTRANIGGLRTEGGSGVSGLLHIEMVVPEYAMSESAVLGKDKTVVLTTAKVNVAADEYPYQGGDSIATITRAEGFTEGSMITDNGVLTLDRITLDGGSKKVKGDGGIVQVNGAVRLTVNEDATLCHSETNGNGGAIWMGSDALLTMSGTIDDCKAANGGGIYADNGFKTLALTGTIRDCSAEADGGAIYAGVGSAGGSSVNLNAGSFLSGNSALSGKGGAVCSMTGLTLRGSVKENEASSGGGIYMGPDTTFTMYSPAEVSGNAATSDGGGLFLYGNSTATIAGGSLLENTAVRGGAIYCDGALRMQGNSSITGNQATNGGAIYVAAEKTFEMAGGSILRNRSSDGAISTGPNSVLTFSGNARVQDNTREDGDSANVYLGYDSNTIIRSRGLGSGAWIGVYTADGDDETIYHRHGIAARNFGTYTGSNTRGARLEGFHNDRHSDLVGTGGERIPDSTDSYIMWRGKALELIVRIEDSTRPIIGAEFTLTNRHELDTDSDDVLVWKGNSSSVGSISIPWSSTETANGNAASFAANSNYVLRETATGSSSGTVRPGGEWRLHVAADNQYSWETIPSPKGQNRTLDIVTESETYYIYNDRYPTVVFNPNNGVLADGQTLRNVPVAFPVDAVNYNFKITEKDPKRGNLVFQYWTTVETPAADTPHYHRDDSIQLYRTADDTLTLYAQWENVVCKITDRDDRLLYVNGVPAVYGLLEDGFRSYNETPRFTYENGTRATARKIQLLTDCKLSEGVTLGRNKTALLTSASKNDSDGYPGKYDPGDPETVCVISRGDFDAPMITNRFNLTLTNITLDGSNTTPEGSNDPVTTNGGIIYSDMADSIATIGAGTTLQNSIVSGDGGSSGLGGAVYAGRRTTLTIRAGKVVNNGAVSGAGIYLAEGSTMEISGAPVFTGNSSSTPAASSAKNGGEPYNQLRQDIYIAGYAGDNNPATSLKVTGDLTGEDGTIWVWPEQESHYKEDLQFAVYSGSNAPDGMTVFRNARTDQETSGRERNGYLTGVARDDRRIYWGTLGVDVIFRKTDGFGKALAGAQFTLYEDPDCTTAVTLSTADGKSEYAESTDVFVKWDDSVEYNVYFKVVPGVYYMKETEQPAGYEENTAKYIVTVTEKRPGISTGPEFQIERLTDTGTPDTLDVANYGIMNVSKAERMAVLRKTDTSFHWIGGAVFDILYWDQTLFADNVSTSNVGLLYSGMLPYGTYYLHETEKSGAAVDIWYTLTVDENGVHCSPQSTTAP